MANSMLVAQAVEGGQKVHLHPLVLLTASDLITRHRLRQLQGPIAGILLGRQQGTLITAEYAFTAKIKDGLLDQTSDWTAKRIEQYKDVHKNPVLEVVGWFTLCPESGPLPEHAVLHKQLTTLYAENAVMLAIHPAEFNAVTSAKSKLPVSMYEGILESELPPSEGAMQVDGKEALGLRFRQISFVIETDETEMIAINYVAKGAGSAAAISTATEPTTIPLEEAKDLSNKTNSPDLKDTAIAPVQKAPILTPEEEDQIAGIATRLNSIRMLQDRLQLMTRLAESTPPSYLSDPTVTLSPSSPSSDYLQQLRNIQALLSRLSLLTPAGQSASETFQHAGRAQANDVAITSLLSMLGQDIQGLSELGRKFLTVEQSRSAKSKSKGAFGPGGFGDLDNYNGRSNADSGLLMM